MTIDRIHQEVKIRWNKLDSNTKPDFYPAQLDDLINKAQEDYVDIFYSGNNSKRYKFGFEVTEQRVDMLQTLVKTYSATPTLAAGKYYVLLSALNPKYRYFLRGSVQVTGCSERVPLTLVRLNDLDNKLQGVNTRPSKKWNRALITIADNRINLYTDGIPLNVEFNYIKDPKRVFIGGYDSLEFLSGDDSGYQSSSPKQTSEIDESFHDILVDMTVQYISRIFEDTNKIEIQQDLLNNKT